MPVQCTILEQDGHVIAYFSRALTRKPARMPCSGSTHETILTESQFYINDRPCTIAMALGPEDERASLLLCTGNAGIQLCYCIQNGIIQW